MNGTTFSLACRKWCSSTGSLLNQWCWPYASKGMSQLVLNVMMNSSCQTTMWLQKNASMYFKQKSQDLLAVWQLGLNAADYYADCWPQPHAADFYLTQLAVHIRSINKSGYGPIFCSALFWKLIGGRQLQLDAVATLPRTAENFYQEIRPFKQIAQGIGFCRRIIGFCLNILDSAKRCQVTWCKNQTAH